MILCILFNLSQTIIYLTVPVRKSGQNKRISSAGLLLSVLNERRIFVYHIILS
jgi:hypothetical protein